MPACSDEEGNKNTSNDAGPGDASGQGGAGAAGGMGGEGGTGAVAGEGGTAGGGAGGTGAVAGEGGSAGVGGSAGEGGSAGVGGMMDAGMDVVVDTTPPTIVSATLSSDSIVSITFSEEMAAPATVDPTNFRLSNGKYYTGEGTYEVYEDLDTSGYQNTYAFTGLALDGTDPTIIEATLANPLTLQDACDKLSEDPNDTRRIYLHYRDDNPPAVTDLALNPTAAVAPAWATPNADAGTLEGFLRRPVNDISEAFPNNPVEVTVDCSSLDGGS